MQSVINGPGVKKAKSNDVNFILGYLLPTQNAENFKF